jgi:hypothetical protein
MDQEAAMKTVALMAMALGGLCAFSCKKDPPTDVPDSSPVTMTSAPEIVPPAAPFNATPVAQLADAGNLEGKSPFEQAQVYEANGQLWMARLVLERQALGSDATREETELLARICVQQNDEGCVDACASKLGRKIKMDAGGAKTPSASASSGVGSEHKEPDSDLARARDLLLKKQLDQARKTLEPKVLDGKASREEVRMLKTICEKQSDRMCVALCDAKLK